MSRAVGTFLCGWFSCAAVVQRSHDDWPLFAVLAAFLGLAIIIDLASVDTHAKRGDSTQIEAPSPMGGAVPEGQTPARSRQSSKPGREM